MALAASDVGPNSSRNCNSPTSISKNAWVTYSSSAASTAAATSRLRSMPPDERAGDDPTLNGDGESEWPGRLVARLNVEQLLRPERRPLSGTGDFRNGRTPFEKLTADFKITEGIAPWWRVSRRIEGPARAGRLGLHTGPGFRSARGCLACRGQHGHRAGVRTAVRGAGPWDDPILLPDTQALIQRSPAASPPAQCGEKSHHPRYRALGHRAADRRRCQPPAGAPAAASNPSPFSRRSRRAGARAPFRL